jgi:S1-C subfamily serine protease
MTKNVQDLFGRIVKQISGSINMDWRLVLMVALIGGSSIAKPVSTHPSPKVAVEQPPTQLGATRLHSLARAITVKIVGKEGGFLGSGILINRKGAIYTVVTNAHVLTSEDSPYSIETVDSRRFKAQITKRLQKSSNTPLKGEDLAVLQFDSTSHNYKVASLESGEKLSIGSKVFAAGFPFTVEGDRDTGFVLKSGQISWVLDKALEGGYRIGYTNDIQKGMSGGPLLNQAGKVVAINGMHANPLWGEPYIYQDGTEPIAKLRQRMTQFSWGIPIETFVKLVNKSGMNIPVSSTPSKVEHE